MSSLTETQYLKLKPSDKGTHYLWKYVFYLYRFVRWTRCIWWAIENNYLLVYKFFELYSWINSYNQKIKQKWSSVQKITCVTAIADKKMISVLCVFWVLCSPPQFAVQIKYFLQLHSIFSRNPQRKRKKTNQKLHVNKAVLQIWLVKDIWNIF